MTKKGQNANWNKLIKQWTIYSHFDTNVKEIISNEIKKCMNRKRNGPFGFAQINGWEDCAKIQQTTYIN